MKFLDPGEKFEGYVGYVGFVELMIARKRRCEKSKR